MEQSLPTGRQVRVAVRPVSVLVVLADHFVQWPSHSAIRCMSHCMLPSTCAGAGKSFTMEGFKQWRAENKPELRGIIPNAMEHIFERVAADSSDETQFLIRSSYLEIYNEEVRDLLAKGKQKGKLEIKSHPDKGVYVDGLTEVRVV